MMALVIFLKLLFSTKKMYQNVYFWHFKIISKIHGLKLNSLAVPFVHCLSGRAESLIGFASGNHGVADWCPEHPI